MKHLFVAALDESRRALLGSLERADPAAVVDGEWSTKDTLAHLAACDLAVLTALRQARRGGPPTWPWDEWPDPNRWNGHEVERRRSASFAEVRRELDEGRAALLAELAGWPADAEP